MQSSLKIVQLKNKSTLNSLVPGGKKITICYHLYDHLFPPDIKRAKARLIREINYFTNLGI